MTKNVTIAETFDQHPLGDPLSVLVITDSMRAAFTRNLEFITTEHITTAFDEKQTGLFTAFRIKSDKLFDHYLSLFPEGQRQIHTCNCCRQFMQKYGGLVSIDKNGDLKSLVWDFEVEDPTWNTIVKGMREYVEKRIVDGALVMKQSDKVAKFGSFEAGGFKHLSLHPHVKVVLESPLFEHHYPISYVTNLINKLGAGDGYEKLKQAKTALTAGVMNRPDLFSWAVDFLYDRIEHINNNKLNPRQVYNLAYRYAVETSKGLFHINGGVVDVLLTRGVDAANAATAGDKYMRPTRETMADTELQKCNDLIAELGLAPSFERRYAALEEIRPDWLPAAKPVEETKESTGFFDSVVKTPSSIKENKTAPVIDGGSVTYRHFREKLLPQAKAIWAEIFSERAMNFTAHTTAVHPDAPRLTNFDRDEDRYPISFFSFVGGSYANMWGYNSKHASTYVEVTGIKEYFEGFAPRHIAGNDKEPAAAFFALKDFKALNSQHASIAGSGIFPASCRSEVRTNSSMRLAVERYSASHPLQNPERASAIGIITAGGLIAGDNERDGRNDRDTRLLHLKIDIGTGVMKVTIDRMS